MTLTAARSVAPDAAVIPIIELWGNLLVSLQGDIVDSQMDDLFEQLLRRLRDRAVRGLVLDVSGVCMVDSHFCASLGRVASAARLMGVRSVLCGLGPDVVMTLQEMGIGLRGIRNALDLEQALHQLGVRARLLDDDAIDAEHNAEHDEERDDADRDPQEARR